MARSNMQLQWRSCLVLFAGNDDVKEDKPKEQPLAFDKEAYPNALLLWKLHHRMSQDIVFMTHNQLKVASCQRLLKAASIIA